MAPQEICDIFSAFDNFERVSISMLVKTLFGEDSKDNCNDTVKVILLIGRLRSSIEQVRPQSLPAALRLRNKRFLFLASQGLELIQRATSSALIKEILAREIDYINAKFNSIDEYDSSRIILNGENFLKEFDRMLEDAKKYDIYAFRCVCGCVCN